MLSSASTKASVSNKMSFWWKIKVTRVQVFLSWVATKQNKGLPARTEEKRGYHRQDTWRKLANNTWNQSFQSDGPIIEFLTKRVGQKKIYIYIYYSCGKFPFENIKFQRKNLLELTRLWSVSYTKAYLRAVSQIILEGFFSSFLKYIALKSWLV